MVALRISHVVSSGWSSVVILTCNMCLHSDTSIEALFVGAVVGGFVGGLVGASIGGFDGDFVGNLVGVFVGRLVGAFVGRLVVGFFVGFSLSNKI